VNLEGPRILLDFRRALRWMYQALIILQVVDVDTRTIFA
jgi:hypothetical protein